MILKAESGVGRRVIGLTAGDEVEFDQLGHGYDTCRVGRALRIALTEGRSMSRETSVGVTEGVPARGGGPYLQVHLPGLRDSSLVHGSLTRHATVKSGPVPSTVGETWQTERRIPHERIRARIVSDREIPGKPVAWWIFETPHLNGYGEIKTVCRCPTIGKGRKSAKCHVVIVGNAVQPLVSGFDTKVLVASVNVY